MHATRFQEWFYSMKLVQNSSLNNLRIMNLIQFWKLSFHEMKSTRCKCRFYWLSGWRTIKTASVHLSSSASISTSVLHRERARPWGSVCRYLCRGRVFAAICVPSHCVEADRCKPPGTSLIVVYLRSHSSLFILDSCRTLWRYVWGDWGATRGFGTGSTVMRGHNFPLLLRGMTSNSYFVCYFPELHKETT